MVSSGEVAGFFEIHVEQGAVLEEDSVTIGVVEGIVGIRRWTATVHGMANHAGTTPMSRRRDALLGAARLVLELNVDSTSGALHAYATMNFLHFAALLFAVCAVLLVVVSLASPAPSRERLAGLTYGTTAPGEAASRHQGVLVGLSLLVAAGVAATWLVFRG